MPERPGWRDRYRPGPATRPGYRRSYPTGPGSTGLPEEQIYVSAKGCEYPAWIANDSRTSATPGDLNDKLVFQIESILRDLVFAENQLTAQSGSGQNDIYCDALAGNTDTYYDGAYCQNFTRGTVTLITGYVALTKRLTFLTNVVGQVAGDKFRVFNVGRTRVNYTSFDTLAATGGVRAGWKGAFSLAEPIDAATAISEIAIDGSLEWFRDYNNQETVRAIDNQVADLTLTSSDIVEVNGLPQIRVMQTSTDEIYNDFTVNYRMNYAVGGFDETETLNAKTVSFGDSRPGFRDGYGTYQALIKASRTKYNIQRKLSLDLPYTRDRDTAIAKIQQLADLYSLQRYMVEMDLVFNATTAKIEEGDFIKITHALLPTGLSSAALFLVVDWTEIPETQTYHIICRELPWGTLAKSAVVSESNSRSAKGGETFILSDVVDCVVGGKRSTSQGDAIVPAESVTITLT